MAETEHAEHEEEPHEPREHEPSEEESVWHDEIVDYHSTDIGVPVGFFSDEEKENFDYSSVVWKDTNNIESTRATIGVALGVSWEQAKKEFYFIRQKLQDKCGASRPKLPYILDIIFGRESPVYRSFLQEGIFADHDEFQRFLATFFLSCSYQVSCKQLFDRHSRIEMKGTLSKLDYTRIWKSIGKASLPSYADRNKTETPTGMVPFWMKLEEAFNSHSRVLFLEGFSDEIQLTVDDDKAHFSGSKYTAGLKVVRHVKDNRNGHTCHTMVHSYSQIPVQIAWERQMNDSSEVCTERCFSNGITPMAAPGSPGDLRHVKTGMDHGYYTKKLLHDYLMKSGAKIEAGTTKRQPCIPMVYGQKLSSKDTRTDISPKGPKTLFIMEATSHGRKLYSHAYRNGTGGVTLGVSTEHGRIPEWELVLANPADLKWYDSPTVQSDEEKAKRCYKAINVDERQGEKDPHYEINGDFLRNIVSLPVRALPTAQGTPEWFLLRRNSLTSSTTDKAIACCNGNEDWLQHTDSWQEIKSVLGRVHTPSIDDDDMPTLVLPTEQDHQAAEHEEEPDPEEEQQTQEPDLTLQGMLSSEDLINLAKNQVNEDELDIGLIRGFLTELGHTLSKASTEERKVIADQKAFDQWLDAAPKLRKYFFQKAATLLPIAQSLGLDTSSCGTRRDPIRKAVNDFLKLNPDAAFEAPTPVSKEPTRTQRINELSDRQRLLHSVIRAGYLDPLKGKAKKHTRRGHQLECHILRSCINEHKMDEIETPIRVSEACTAPLVERDGKRHARDSIDFIASASGGSIAIGQELIGVEIKARVSHLRDQAETQHAEQIRRLLGQDRTPRQRKVKYFEINADTEDFTTLVADTHEAVQVLHHAYVYNFDYVLLLVGNNNGKVLYGVFVHVSETLRVAYGDILWDIYDSSLKWLYEDLPAPDDGFIDPVLKEIEVNKAPVDNRSFKMDVALWKDVNTNMLFPIPRLARIILLMFSFWNTIKGGSDATTNLIWHCAYSVPSDENQSIVVARILSLCSIHVHRLHQLSTAKEDLDFYSSLKRFRDSATERRSFKKTLTMIVDLLTNVPESTPPTPPPVVVPRQVVEERVSRSRVGIQRFELPMVQTNKTPKRNVANRLQLMENNLELGKLDARSKVVLDRMKQCTGFAVWRTGEDGSCAGKGGRGTCAHCGAQTHSFCLGCKRWLCSSSSKKAQALPGWKHRSIFNATGKEPVYCETNCFFIMHREAQETAVLRFNQQARLQF